jgi:hypothetical protein
VGCYFYSQENRLIDIASFRLCYNLNKHTSDYDSIFRLRPVSWAVAVIGPPVRMNICGIIRFHARKFKGDVCGGKRVVLKITGGGGPKKQKTPVKTCVKDAMSALVEAAKQGNKEGIADGT